MKEFAYHNYPNQEPLSLSEEQIALREMVQQIGTKIKDKASADTGWKGGSFSTSYEYKVDRFVWHITEADDESSHNMWVDGVHIAKIHTSYYSGHFDYLNEQTIQKIYSQIFNNTNTEI